MMTATARPESPRAADALHKIAAAAASVGGGDENASTNANKPPTKKPKEAPKQQPSESDENDEEEDDEEEEEEEEDTKPKVSSSTKEDKQNTTEDDKKTSKKSRRELPPHTVAILKGWMLSPEHVKHPYPTDEDKQMLLKKTGINMKQLTNWFTNARKRIWKPMMRREHSRQLQSAMEFEKARGGPNAYPMAPPPNMPPYAREGAYPPRAAIRHSFDAGSLGGPPRDPMGYGHPYNAPPPPQAYPPPAAHAYPPRTVRSVSESATRHEMDDYIDAMRIRKRVHEMGPETMETDSKRFRRGAVLSPRCLQILHEWVAANRHMEYPTPGDSDKLQLSRDTGLDVQQIELWFKTNVGLYGALLQPPPQSAASAAMQHPAYRSIPSRDNPMYPPPPAYGERRSIPSQGNPMFPPRPAVRSSIPGAGNPQFPPPPAVRRDGSDGFRGGMQPPGYPGGGVYPPPPHQGYEADGSRSMRTMSVNSGQYPPTSGAPMPTIPAPVGAPGLPSLTGRPVPGARLGPPMGQARDSRSHTLDMGQFADARRRKMNFQDILASTSAPQIPSQLQAQSGRPTSGNGAPFDTSRLPTAENLYPAKAVSPYAQQARGGGSTSSNASNADPQGPGSRI